MTGLGLLLALANLVASILLVVVFLLALRRERRARYAAERAAGQETAYASMKSAELENAQRYVGTLARHFAAELHTRDAARASQLLVTARVWEYDADVEKRIRERAAVRDDG